MSRTPLLVSALFALFSTAACGPFAPPPQPALPDGELPPPPTPVRSAPPKTASSGGANAGTDTEADTGSSETEDAPVVYDGKTGSIAGVVEFKGIAPARKELAVGGVAGCEHDGPVLSETVIVTDGKLANVFVYVSKGIKDWKGPVPEPLTLDQRGCVYSPHVAGAMVGQVVRASNSDPLAHNVHVIAKRNSSPNKTQSAGMKPLELKFDRDEVPVVLVCDIHPWMKAFLCVQDHPFFAVTGTDGRFEIPDLPPGQYTLTAWHEKYGKEKSGKVTVSPEGTTSVDFQFKP